MTHTFQWTGFFRVLVRAFTPAVILVLTQVLLMFVGWYAHYPWFDMPMHLVGGFIIAYGISTTLTGLQRMGVVQNLDRPIRAVLVFSLVVTSAVFWELYEHFGDMLLPIDLQISLQNTMQDLMLGMVGGLVFLLFANRQPKGLD